MTWVRYDQSADSRAVSPMVLYMYILCKDLYDVWKAYKKYVSVEKFCGEVGQNSLGKILKVWDNAQNGFHIF